MKKLLLGFLFLGSILLVSCGNNCPNGQSSVNGVCQGYGYGGSPYGYGGSPYGYGGTMPYGGGTMPYGGGTMPYGGTTPYGYGGQRPPQCMNYAPGSVPGC